MPTQGYGDNPIGSEDTCYTSTSGQLTSCSPAFSPILRENSFNENDDRQIHAISKKYLIEITSEVLSYYMAEVLDLRGSHSTIATTKVNIAH